MSALPPLTTRKTLYMDPENAALSDGETSDPESSVAKEMRSKLKYYGLPARRPHSCWPESSEPS